MRNLRVLALLAGLGWCCRAQAAVDCNMPEFEFVNDAYVCLSGTFKAQNNQIQDMEDKLKRPSEKIRNELAQVKKKLARETGDTPKASAARKKLEKWADELRRRVDEADRDAREKRNFIGQIKNEGRECRTEKCMKEVYAKTLAGLIGFSRQPACTLPQIADECEVYVYNTPPQAKKSMAPLLSEKLYTYREKVRINRPDKCVYLFLASGYPQVWDIYATPATDLQAVVAGGHEEQMLRGMNPKVQTKVRDGNHRAAGDDVCLGSYYGKDEIVEAVRNLNLGVKNVRLLDKPVIGEEVDDKFYEYNPQVIDGEFVMPEIAPANTGLEQLTKEGKLRKAGKDDIAKIKAAGYSFLTGVSLKGDRNPFEYGALRMYVLLKEFVRLPRGLAGSDGIVLMVPKDMRVPDNNDGHNDFYRVDLPASEFWADK